MKYFKNDAFEKSVNLELEKISDDCKADYNSILNLFDKKEIYIMGGFVRDCILKSLYNYSFPINDLDVFITDLDFDKKIKIFNQKNLFMSRFGALKFKYPNFSMDVFGFNNIFFLDKTSFLNKNLENVLNGCDISTSALAYNLETKEFFGGKAVEDISSKKLEILNKYIPVGPTIARLILHADKMGFSFGETAEEYLRENYNPETLIEVKKWLNYKEKDYLYPLIDKRWKMVLNLK